MKLTYRGFRASRVGAERESTDVVAGSEDVHALWRQVMRLTPEYDRRYDHFRLYDETAKQYSDADYSAVSTELFRFAGALPALPDDVRARATTPQALNDVLRCGEYTHLPRSQRRLVRSTAREFDKAHPISLQNFTHEHRLVLYTNYLACTIKHHPAWNSAELASHRVRLNLDEEILQVAERAMAIHRVRSQIGPTPPDEHGALEAWQRTTRRLDTVLDTLALRVANLHRYASSLDTVERQRQALSVIEAVESIEGQLSPLEARGLSDAGQAEHTADLSDELSHLERLLRAIIGARCVDVSNLDLDAHNGRQINAGAGPLQLSGSAGIKPPHAAADERVGGEGTWR